LAGGLQLQRGMSHSPALIQRIIVPHDFSETANRALEYGLGLAERLGASVTVVHAYEIPVYGFPEGPVVTTEMAGQIEKASRSAMDALAKRAKRPGVEVSFALRQGPAWSEIQAVAKETKADLVVIGSHGRRGLSRALLGSVAEKVVRTAPCPVLTVRSSEP
jgi:nucleotide-binding universal stress UspA family protein